MGFFFFNCRMTKNERRIVFWTKTVELVFSIFLDLPSTSPDAVAALYRNLSLLTLNTKKMFLLTTSCLLAMAGFISELAGSVPFFLASLRTCAGSLEGLCSTYCVPETLLTEAFAEIKMSLKRRQTGKRRIWKWGKIGFTSPYLECCVAATAPAQFSFHSTGTHLQLGHTRTVFYTISVGELCHLHPWNEHARYFFLTLLTFEGQISDPQNTRAGFKADFWISRLFWEALEEPWERGCLWALSTPAHKDSIANKARSTGRYSPGVPQPFQHYPGECIILDLLRALCLSTSTLSCSCDKD